MCWTQRKADKLNYFRKTLMWYLNDAIANIETLAGPAGRNNLIKEFHYHNGGPGQWDYMARKICARSDNSP